MIGPKIKPIILIGNPANDNLNAGIELMAAILVPMITKEIDIAIKNDALDDIFDKLDDSRVEQLVKLVGNDHFGQVFITDTQKYRIKLLMDNAVVNHKIFRVKQGVITIDDE